MAKQRSASSARAARIIYSDIPASTPEQLAAFRRIGRPPLGNEARQSIAIRLDVRVLAAYRKEAKRRGVGYQTLITRCARRCAGQRQNQYGQEVFHWCPP